MRNRALLSLIVLVFLGSSLTSCSSYDSAASRLNTRFYLKDSTLKMGELLYVSQDSVYMIDPFSEHATTTAIHYSELDEVIFLNKASAALNGVGGLIGGGLLGGITGLVLGAAADGYRTLPYSPVSYEHSGGWGALIGMVIGVPIGALFGLGFGLEAGSDKNFYIDEASDIEGMSEFARYKYQVEFEYYRR